MYPRTNYEMTNEQLNELLSACKPINIMKIGDYVSASPQENANRAWGKLGENMGFDSMTVRPISGKGDRFFSAIPLENETQAQDRIKREAEEKRIIEIRKLEDEIAEKQTKLAAMMGEKL